MLALPDKYHGLEDIEIRYRQRYADLFTNPEVRDVFVKRAHILRSVRHFFDSHGYLEVETPMLHTIAGGATARTFTTHHNAEDMELTLRIAPELHLKRLVVGGLDRVYEINRNFRNEGIDRTHNPEFTMLEFYQAYANYHDLMALTQDLIISVAKEVNGTTLTTLQRQRDRPRQMDTPLHARSHHQVVARRSARPNRRHLHRPHLAMPAVFSLYMYYNSPTQDEDDVLDFASSRRAQGSCQKSSLPLARLQAGRALYIKPWKIPQAQRNSPAQPSASSSPESSKPSPKTHLIQPTIIYDYPLAVSPLSKLKPDEPDWVERFEFYIGGFELGNGFSELNDPDDQLRRFKSQLDDRKRGDAEAMAEVDYDYVRALGYGLPPTAGEGIGIDRLTMVLTGSRTIRDVMLFPLMRPQKPSTEPTPEPTQPHGESAE